MESLEFVDVPTATLRAIAGPDMVVLRTPVHLHGENFTTVGEFIVGEGDRVPFVMSYGPSHLAVPEAFAADASALASLCRNPPHAVMSRIGIVNVPCTTPCS